MFRIISFLFFTSLFVDVPAQTNYYVSPSGNDSNPGTLSQPWRTLQHAANTVSAGDTVFVRNGTYNETVTLNVSGSQAGGYITFINYPGESPVVDGTGLSLSEDTGLFRIEDKNYIKIIGFEIRNFTSSTQFIVPSGIFITGSSNHLEIRGNKIHDISHTANPPGRDAHGIAVYGTNPIDSINSVIIDDNELYNLTLGSSEALVLNGNVSNFQVTNNTVHDADNIGIDFIGFERTCPDETFDQARNGTVSGNVVYNISSYGNPAYGNEYAAGGIYADGGKDITIERNIVHNSDIGVELASENNGKSTSGIILRNNLLYNNNIAGIAIGGYDTQRGSTDNCKILNNTLYQNDVQFDGNGELWIRYDVNNTIIENNIFDANNQGLLISYPFTKGSNITIDYNLYFSPLGENNSEWQWKTVSYTGFSAYRNGTGNDPNSIFNNPLFADENNSDFHLQNNSPAIDIGNNLADIGNYDLDGNPRIQNGRVDLGGYETTSTVKVSVKIYLEGPYDSNTDMMTTQINSLIPNTSPYSEDPRTVSQIPSTIVDWVLVSLRTAANGANIVSKSAFLRNDGKIVDDDGTTEEIIMNADEENYFIVIKHRNHLAVMSATAIALNGTTSTLCDFTTSESQFYGSGGSVQLENGIWGMWSGDADGSGVVDAADRNSTWNNRNKSGYETSDVNLSGVVDAGDRNNTWNNRNKSSAVP